MANGGQEYSLNLGLDVLPISTDKDNLPDINRLYNAVKNVARGLDEYTQIISVPKDEWPSRGIQSLRLQNASKIYVKAAEIIPQGSFVDLYYSAPDLLARRANPSNGPAKGFVLESFAAAEFAEIYLAGVNTRRSGLTPADVYLLATGTDTIRTTGTYVVGFALSTTALWFNPAYQ